MEAGRTKRAPDGGRGLWSSPLCSNRTPRAESESDRTERAREEHERRANTAPLTTVDRTGTEKHLPSHILTGSDFIMCVKVNIMSFRQIDFINLH